MKRNNLVMVELPPPLGGAGREQTGRRPAVVVQDEISSLSTILVAPLTSQLAALRFPYTLRIEPSPENGLSVSSVILLFRLPVVDWRRVLRVIGELESQHVQQLDLDLRFSAEVVTSTLSCSDLPRLRFNPRSIQAEVETKGGGIAASLTPEPSGTAVWPASIPSTATRSSPPRVAASWSRTTPSSSPTPAS